MHGPARAQIVGTSQAVCLFACSTSAAFGAVCEYVSGEALASASPRGCARGYCTGPLALRLGGCLRRFACLRAQHPLPSEQFARMSQARRGFQPPHGGAPGGIARARSRSVCEDVSGGLPVCVFNIRCLRSSLRRCLRRGAGFSLPKGVRQGVLHGPARAQNVGMSQAVCLFACSTSAAFGAVCEYVSGEALASASPRGCARGYCTGPLALRLGGCLRRFACLRAQHPLPSEQFARMCHARRWFQPPPRGGGARGYCTGPLALRLWGCLRRLTCLRVQHPLPSEQFGRMSQARRWVSFPKGWRQGVLHGPARGQIVGMSQAVCLFACSTSAAFGAVCEDVSSEALVSASPRVPD